MATYTTHYNLKKPEPTDTSEIITDLNTNYDSIDTYLYQKASTSHASTHITGGTDVIPDAVAGESSGLMSGADKQKLDSINTSFSAHIIDIAPHQTQQLLYLTDPINEITYRFGISGNHMYYEEVI